MEKYAIGVDIGGTKIETALVTGNGRLIESLRIPTDSISGPDKIINNIIEAVETLSVKHTTISIDCIGIGVAGQIEKNTEDVIYAPNLNWQNVNLKERITAKFAKPVAICNDVRAAAWGEWLAGAGAGCDNLVCVFVGTGIGGAIICNGQMVNGHNNTAGEIGHIIAKENGPRCHCGNNGCFEALAGGWAIMRDAQQAVQNNMIKGKILLALSNGNINAITAATVIKAAMEGDAIANEIVDKFTRVMSDSITSIINTLGPEKIIMGGGIIEGMPQVIKTIDKYVKANALHAATANVLIIPAKLQNNAGSIGAALFALKKYSV